MTAAHSRLHVSGAPAIESPAETASAEERLWRAVIDVAFRDAVELPKIWFGIRSAEALQIRRERLRQEARDWLLNNNRDFVIVCDLAGRDPSEVRDQARRLLSSADLRAAFVDVRRTSAYRTHNRVKEAS